MAHLNVFWAPCVSVCVLTSASALSPLFPSANVSFPPPFFLSFFFVYKQLSSIIRSARRLCVFLPAPALELKQVWLPYTLL